MSAAAATTKLGKCLKEVKVSAATKPRWWIVLSKKLTKKKSIDKILQNFHSIVGVLACIFFSH